jgi:hypothetical protein
MNTNSFQKILNAIFLLLTMFLLCWNIKLSLSQSKLLKLIENSQSQLNELKIDDRLTNVEDGWYQFLDMMFGEQDQPLHPQ